MSKLTSILLQDMLGTAVRAEGKERLYYRLNADMYTKLKSLADGNPILQQAITESQERSNIQGTYYLVPVDLIQKAQAFG